MVAVRQPAGSMLQRSWNADISLNVTFIISQQLFLRHGLGTRPRYTHTVVAIWEAGIKRYKRNRNFSPPFPAFQLIGISLRKVPDSAWFPFSLERCQKICVPQVWAQLSVVIMSRQVLRFVLVELLRSEWRTLSKLKEGKKFQVFITYNNQNFFWTTQDLSVILKTEHISQFWKEKYMIFSR